MSRKSSRLFSSQATMFGAGRRTSQSGLRGIGHAEARASHSSGVNRLQAVQSSSVAPCFARKSFGRPVDNIASSTTAASLQPFPSHGPVAVVGKSRAHCGSARRPSRRTSWRRRKEDRRWKESRETVRPLLSPVDVELVFLRGRAAGLRRPAAARRCGRRPSPSSGKSQPQQRSHCQSAITFRTVARMIAGSTPSPGNMPKAPISDGCSQFHFV